MANDPPIKPIPRRTRPETEGPSIKPTPQPTKVAGTTPATAGPQPKPGFAPVNAAADARAGLQAAREAGAPRAIPRPTGLAPTVPAAAGPVTVAPPAAPTVPAAVPLPGETVKIKAPGYKMAPDRLTPAAPRSGVNPLPPSQFPAPALVPPGTTQIPAPNRKLPAKALPTAAPRAGVNPNPIYQLPAVRPPVIEPSEVIPPPAAAAPKAARPIAAATARYSTTPPPRITFAGQQPPPPTGTEGHINRGVPALRPAPLPQAVPQRAIPTTPPNAGGTVERVNAPSGPNWRRPLDALPSPATISAASRPPQPADPRAIPTTPAQATVGTVERAGVRPGPVEPNWARPALGLPAPAAAPGSVPTTPPNAAGVTDLVPTSRPPGADPNFNIVRPQGQLPAPPPAANVPRGGRQSVYPPRPVPPPPVPPTGQRGGRQSVYSPVPESNPMTIPQVPPNAGGTTDRFGPPPNPNMAAETRGALAIRPKPTSPLTGTSADPRGQGAPQPRPSSGPGPSGKGPGFAEKTTAGPSQSAGEAFAADAYGGQAAQQAAEGLASYANPAAVPKAKIFQGLRNGLGGIKAGIGKFGPMTPRAAIGEVGAGLKNVVPALKRIGGLNVPTGGAVGRALSSPAFVTASLAAQAINDPEGTARNAGHPLEGIGALVHGLGESIGQLPGYAGEIGSGERSLLRVPGDAANALGASSFKQAAGQVGDAMGSLVMDPSTFSRGARRAYDLAHGTELPGIGNVAKFQAKATEPLDQMRERMKGEGQFRVPKGQAPTVPGQQTPADRDALMWKSFTDGHVNPDAEDGVTAEQLFAPQPEVAGATGTAPATTLPTTNTGAPAVPSQSPAPTVPAAGIAGFEEDGHSHFAHTLEASYKQIQNGEGHFATMSPRRRAEALGSIATALSHMDAGYSHLAGQQAETAANAGYRAAQIKNLAAQDEWHREQVHNNSPAGLQEAADAAFTDVDAVRRDLINSKVPYEQAVHDAPGIVAARRKRQAETPASQSAARRQSAMAQSDQLAAQYGTKVPPRPPAPTVWADQPAPVFTLNRNK